MARMPERLDEEELADWRAGRNAVYQLAALTVGARLAVADACAEHKGAALRGTCRRQNDAVRKENPGGGRPGLSRRTSEGKNSIVQEISNSITQ